MSRRTWTLAALLAVSSTAALAVTACSGGQEEAILTHFFTAARLRDNTTLGSFATADFDPRTRGMIVSFSVDNISPERRNTLSLKALAKAQDDAKAEDAEFTKRKTAYQDENLDVIEQVVKAGREAKLKGKVAEIQSAWYKFVDQGAEISRKVADARRKLLAERDIVELSAIEPGRTMDVTKYDGDLVSKDVTITAPVKMPDGKTVTKTLLITLQRAELKGGDQKPVVGRWIVSTIKEATTPAGTKTS